jgi:hypothetical protein
VTGIRFSGANFGWTMRWVNGIYTFTGLIAGAGEFYESFACGIGRNPTEAEYIERKRGEFQTWVTSGNLYGRRCVVTVTKNRTFWTYKYEVGGKYTAIQVSGDYILHCGPGSDSSVEAKPI